MTATRLPNVKPLVFHSTEVQWGTTDRSLVIRVMHGVTGEYLDNPHSGEIYIELQDADRNPVSEKTIEYQVKRDRVIAKVLRP